ncbi:MAG: hypothetical protein ACAI25_09715 [Planctomycetota bacterium]
MTLAFLVALALNALGPIAGPPCPCKPVPGTPAAGFGVTFPLGGR